MLPLKRHHSHRERVIQLCIEHQQREEKLFQLATSMITAVVASTGVDRGITIFI